MRQRRKFLSWMSTKHLAATCVQRFIRGALGRKRARCMLQASFEPRSPSCILLNNARKLWWPPPTLHGYLPRVRWTAPANLLRAATPAGNVMVPFIHLHRVETFMSRTTEQLGNMRTKRPSNAKCQQGTYEKTGRPRLIRHPRAVLSCGFHVTCVPPLYFFPSFRLGLGVPFQEYFDREMAAVDAEVERWVGGFLGTAYITTDQQRLSWHACSAFSEPPGVVSSRVPLPLHLLGNGRIRIQLGSLRFVEQPLA